ncbi:MAG: preprotein translocase subunit SecG [Burkholderiaceae bacterium]|nr:preprotein translocase subunit SecG [Burkholderiaceae bacterium]
MEMLWSIVVVTQVLSAIGVIVLVLIQHGKGADMGAAFGSGSSGSLFGATGSANFLSRTTAACAAVFFASTLGLAFVTNQSATVSRSVMDQPASSVPVPSSVPAAGTGGTADQKDSGAGAVKDGPAGQIPK